MPKHEASVNKPRISVNCLV